MSITAKELAEKLGISASAVSIALNGKKGSVTKNVISFSAPQRNMV